MALTVASEKATIQGGTVVRVRITAADDQSGETVAIPTADIPAGVPYRLADVRARDDAGSATSWAPQVALDGVVIYLATAGTPGDLADQPGCVILRAAGETLEAGFGWNSGTDNDGLLELVFVPVGVA